MHTTSLRLDGIGGSLLGFFRSDTSRPLDDLELSDAAGRVHTVSLLSWPALVLSGGGDDNLDSPVLSLRPVVSDGGTPRQFRFVGVSGRILEDVHPGDFDQIAAQWFGV